MQSYSVARFATPGGGVLSPRCAVSADNVVRVTYDSLNYSN